jgi:large subunit ribosomal protein L21
LPDSSIALTRLTRRLASVSEPAHPAWGLSAPVVFLNPQTDKKTAGTLPSIPQGRPNSERQKMFAVIKTGGKQYRVVANDVLKIEKVAGEVGDVVEIGHVLAHGEGDSVTFGAPFVDGALVTAEVVAQGRAATVIAFKKRRRQNSRRRHGHRQYETTVRIDEILIGGAKPSKKTAAKKEPAKKEAEVEAKPAKKAKAPAAEATPVAAFADVTPKAKPAKAKAAKAEVVDDISLISGVGPVLKEKLTEAGYATLTSISKLKKADIAKLDEELGLGGRVEREEWVAQAKELLAGKPPRAQVDKDAAAGKESE